MKIATTFLSAVASAKADHRSVLTILRSRSAFILIALALGAFAFAEKAQAISPPPDGGYPNGNTAEGQATLFSLTTGTFNTAVGFFSLRAFSDGNFNTGVGAGALLANTATGATSNIRFIVPELDTKVNSIVFNPGASRFTIALQAQTLTISGVGITNNSGIMQHFASSLGVTEFANSATAGSLTLFTNNGTCNSSN